MGMNKENAKSFEEMAIEMDAAPETVAETTEKVAETTEEVTDKTDVVDEVTDETKTEKEEK